MTYWDYLGWHDPFSSPDATKRQRDYGTAMRGSVSTPQMVINGTHDVVSSDRPKVLRTIRQAASSTVAAAPVQLRRDGDAVGVAMRLSVLGLGLALALGSASAQAETLPDWPDVVVFCEPTLLHAMTDLGAVFRAQTGTPVRVFTAPGSMLVRQANHTRNDILVLQGSAVMDEAARIDAIRPDTRVSVGGNRLVVARRGAGAEEKGGLASTLGAQTVAAVDPGVPELTGRATQQALGAAGLSPRISGVVGTADAVFLLETGAVARAIVFATDVAANPGLSIAAVVPQESYPKVIYLAAVSHDARGATPARFLALLTSPEGQKHLHDAGMEIAQ